MEFLDLVKNVSNTDLVAKVGVDTAENELRVVEKCVLNSLDFEAKLKKKFEILRSRTCAKVRIV